MTRDAATPRDRGLAAIAVFKLIKAVVLIAAGIGVIHLVRGDGIARLVDALEDLTLPAGRHLIEDAVGLLVRATPLRLGLLGSGSILYGALFGVEGTGLWLGKRWAEYLTVVGTASLLPIEVVPLVHRFGLLKALAFAVNLAIVAYLVHRLWRSRRSPPARAAP